MRGRKTKYTHDRVEKICNALAEGKSEKDSCLTAGISVSQFHFWLNQKTEFSEAVKKAKAQYQEWYDKNLLESAERGLRRLIEGEEYIETTTEYENDGTGQPRIKKQKTVTKRIPPNITALIFALTNRAPDIWKNRISQDVNGKIQTESKSDISLANVPDDLLEKVIESIRK